jgi:hypothetical protein
MVLLALPPADHLLNERDRGQFVPSRRRRMMANVRAERLLKIPAEPSPELLIPGAAGQTRIVSMAGIRLGSWESARAFKGIICDDISEFESHMPRSLASAQPGNRQHRMVIGFGSSCTESRWTMVIKKRREIFEPASTKESRRVDGPGG